MPSDYDPGPGWVSILAPDRVTRTGAWEEHSFRYARTTCLRTEEDGAALTVRFTGTGIALGLGQHAVPAYGKPNLGRLLVTVDGGDPTVVYPRDEAREVVIARGLEPGSHTLRIEHRIDAGMAGCRISGIRELASGEGDLAFTLNGEDNGYFVDARAVLRSGDRIIRNALVRNWLNGACRLPGIPAGTYKLELIAFGWEPRVVDDITVIPGEETRIPPVYLGRLPDTRPNGVRWPVLGRPAVRKPGESFRLRTVVYDSPIERVTLSRSVGPATISRNARFDEDPAAAFYYDREGDVTIPEDTPAGLYDLTVSAEGSRGAFVRRSPRSVYVVADYPTDPVFVTFGHLDTQGQYQAEYERRLAEITNLIAPDALLVSNAVNPAYVSGAHLPLEVPYLVTFGNHQFEGHERWYGDPVGIVDYGPDLCILNFGDPWHVDLSHADALFAARSGVRHKVINGYEANAPEAFLDRHGVQLIHDAHGPGTKVMEIGNTSTLRVGKVNSSSFRVVRFRNGRVASATYRGDDIAPIPFDRGAPSPVRVSFDPANDGTRDRVTATVTNDLEEAFPDGRITFILPSGAYDIDTGRVEASTPSDDGRHTILAIRLDIPASGTASVTAARR